MFLDEDNQDKINELLMIATTECETFDSVRRGPAYPFIVVEGLDASGQYYDFNMLRIITKNKWIYFLYHL